VLRQTVVKVCFFAMRFPLFSTACLSLAFSPTVAGADEFYEQTVVPFIQKYCIECHGDDHARASFRIDRLHTDFLVRTNADMWHEVIDNMNLGLMPPPRSPQPDADQVFQIVEWVGHKIHEAEREVRMAGGQAVMRRLNREEYANTVVDLFQLRPEMVESVRELLPADGTAEGFDRIATALFVDQTQLEQYLAAGREVARMVIREPLSEPEVMIYKAAERKRDPQTVRRTATSVLRDNPMPVGPPTSENRPDGLLMWGGGINNRPDNEWLTPPPGGEPTLTDLVREDGYYRIRVKGGVDLGKRGTPIILRLTYAPRTPYEQEIDIEVQGTIDAPEVVEQVVYLRAGGEDMARPMRWQWNGMPGVRVSDEGYQEVNAAMNRAVNAVTRAVEEQADAETLRQLEAERDAAIAALGAYPGNRYQVGDGIVVEELPKLLLDWIEVSGPVDPEWPPASHAVLGFNGSGVPETEQEIRAVFERFLPLAYRRVVQPGEADRFVRLVARARSEFGLNAPEALRVGMQAVLAAPGFLYLTEPQPEQVARRLTGVEFANRLSYFLWSSMPDIELLQLGMSGELFEPAVLQQQLMRMLEDPRSERFVENFAGQWLDVRRYGSVQPAREYSDYDDELEAASKLEPLLFFDTVLRKNLPITNFIDSDFLVVNERLARHYGIEGVEGPEFRKVSIPEGVERGGVLGMAGLLTLLSDGTRTLPVTRAAWVREKLLHDPPPPPPPGAGEVQPNTAGQMLSVRERLELHRDEPTCASCHAALDGYGLALENYDAIGAWRTHQNGEGIRGNNAPVIDASGNLKSGRQFQDLRGYKEALLEEKDKFAEAFVKTMLTYALSRPVGVIDNSTVQQLHGYLTANEYRIQPLLYAIVTSELFQTK